MKLYELSRGDRFKLMEEAHGAPDAPEPQLEEVYKFQKVDGMYASCLDGYGNVTFIPAYADVEVV